MRARHLPGLSIQHHLQALPFWLLLPMSPSGSSVALHHRPLLLRPVPALPAWLQLLDRLVQPIPMRDSEGSAPRGSERTQRTWE